MLQFHSAEDENKDCVELLLLKTWPSFSDETSCPDRGMNASAWHEDSNAHLLEPIFLGTDFERRLSRGSVK